MANKMTAVEWLVKELKDKEYLGVFCTPDAWEEEEKQMSLIIQQAKEMEKEQNNRYYNSGKCMKLYKETYGGKK